MRPTLSAESGAANSVHGTDAPAWLDTNHLTEAAQAPQQTPDTQPLSAYNIGRTAIGLVVVLGIIFLCSVLLKKFGPYKRTGDRTLNIIAGRNLGSRERIVVVEVEQTWLVLGVTQHNIRTLHTMPARHDKPDMMPDDAARDTTPPTFTQAFSDNLRQTMRRFSGRD